MFSYILDDLVDFACSCSACSVVVVVVLDGSTGCTYTLLAARYSSNIMKRAFPRRGGS